MGTSKITVSDAFGMVSDPDVATMDIEDGKEDDAVDSPLPTVSSAFREGEKVLAFHGQRLYEAKVQKVDFQMNEWRYFVHYLGWNKNWDEWVGFERLIKHTKENLQKQQEVNKKLAMDMSANAKTGRSMPKSSIVPRGRKRRMESVQKEKGSLLIEKRVNIQIPPTLKKQLIDDCESTTHMGKLVKLPRSPSVDEIFRKYHHYRLKKDGTVDSIGEILNGLRCYFDKALPAMLLYKNERQQFEEMVISKNITPSAIYGAEHLLRLFVKLPEILYYANIEQTTLSDLQHNLVDFLKFLQKNQNSFFCSTYRIGDVLHATSRKHNK